MGGLPGSLAGGGGGGLVYAGCCRGGAVGGTYCPLGGFPIFGCALILIARLSLPSISSLLASRANNCTDIGRIYTVRSPETVPSICNILRSRSGARTAAYSLGILVYKPTHRMRDTVRLGYSRRYSLE